MITGIGVDLVTVSRVEQVHERFGERFARRILGNTELEEYRNSTYPARFLAKRFAAKEAAVKALGTGEREGVLLKDFTIAHDHLGKPLLNVDGKAAELCHQHGINQKHVTLTDERDQIVAFVVLET